MTNLEIETNTLRAILEGMIRDNPDMADDETLRADMLDGETNLIPLLTEIHRQIDDATAMWVGTANRLNELSSRKARFEKRVEFYRALVLKLLQSADLRKVELPECTLSLRNNPPQLLITAVAGELPDDLVKIKREPDRVKIRAALENGREVPGFYLNNAPPTLTVRVK
jgi:Gp157 protein